MLSRTAENLFWITRYMARAETIARLLEVGSRNALIPSVSGGFRNEWESILQASGTAGGFVGKYGDPVQRNVESYLFFDLDNPSSIASCISRARENGRIVRTALTSQVWDALNTAFQEMQELRRTERSKLSVNDLIDWTIRNSSMVRGAIEDSQLRNDGWSFMHIGYALERADATARLLDVKYFVLLPQVDFVGSGLDNYQWRTILRAMSAHRAFNWAYGGEITPAKIADFLILNTKSPRSLITCATEANTHLEALARGYGRSGDAQAQSRALLARLSEITVEDVFDVGLHEFLTGVIDAVAGLTAIIHEQYLSGEAR
ncbi:alpha-E domain-containing protein [Palleronia sp. KMU-117]|uniref:alpha-E domain-containing protein n=1 Tax=Palleronia sp. KMU-117 TaxID=3434108 RepID=UPI003D712EA7